MNMEIQNAGAALRREHMDDEEACADSACWTSTFDESCDTVAFRSTATICEEDSVTRLSDTNASDTKILSRTRDANWPFAVSILEPNSSIGAHVWIIRAQVYPMHRGL